MHQSPPWLAKPRGHIQQEDLAAAGGLLLDVDDVPLLRLLNARVAEAALGGSYLFRRIRQYENY